MAKQNEMDREIEEIIETHGTNERSIRLGLGMMSSEEINEIHAGLFGTQAGNRTTQTDRIVAEIIRRAR